MKVIDLTAGTKMMWFDNSIDVKYCDLVPKSADVQKVDWSDRLPFDTNTFDLAVFDPPHLTRSYAGTGVIASKYGYLFDTWQSDLINAFHEVFRVCRSGSIVIFKWNTRQFSIYQVLALIPYKPLFGHTSAWTNKASTIWALFLVP